MFPTKLSIWKMAIRPKTLPAAISPVLVGIGFAVHFSQFAIGPSIAALIGALLLQISSNLSNDYFDHLRGHDTSERKGPQRVMSSGLLTPKEMKFGMLIVILLAILDGLYLIYIGGLVILLIGVFSIISSLAYSGGPYPLSSHGLGDIFVFVFFGLIAVNGTYFVQAKQFELAVFIGSIPIGFLITAILVVNNYRDMETDKSTNKKTLVVRWGLEKSQFYFSFIVISSYFIPIILILFFNFSLALLLPLISIVKANSIITQLKTLKGPALNKTLGSTAQLSLIFGILFTIGLLWS
ncbi:MAG: 1,4-dihydroxy-2-naphthoate polyprenyltransferase [Candidatus Heimdallarchaeota archaeon]|nr:1,4-dihydroxy-2-naphthoate polyprenyltransferase [Candidatus Heimdallarchaeota archaeon]MDH5646571.1 1,4-dihydroxy-2-naphthoate polyprenyltransferase [Candidatus Heimdallarchaeota archaeon]